MDCLLYSCSRRTISEWGTAIIAFMASLKRLRAVGPSIISTGFVFMEVTILPMFKRVQYA
jgi:hypothetical protein